MTEQEPDSAIPVVSKPRQYGTLGGVFTPTLLTILGVIMYLRLPWVIGNGGLLGGLLIIGLAIAITTATGLSLSSISTNTRLGTGGPYAIISRSLGLEIGGSVGVPLYLSQALAVAMYIFGFREGWNWVFPDHPPLLVDLTIFAVIFAIAYISAGLAFKIQYVVVLVIIASLISVFANVDVWSSDNPIVLWGDFLGSAENGLSGTDFWTVFAVFFPAATGIMAGANMSGELRNPRRSIPLGTLSAIGISTVVYVALAFWSARAASPVELAGNYNVMIDHALYAPIVVAGLLGATFSSALASLVGAPRILLALAQDKLVPRGEFFSKVSPSGEPRRGMLLTGVIVLAALMSRDLNIIAPLISMFFLITYAVINAVMLIESSLGSVSFRPTLKLPRIVPLLGALGCLFAMFIVNPIFSLVAWAMVFALYFWIMQQKLGHGSDSRSGIFVAFAEWAASKVTELNLDTARAWKPSFLVPVVDGSELRGAFSLLSDICSPAGSVKLLGIADEQSLSDLMPRIEKLGREMRKKVFTTWSVIDSAGVAIGVAAGMQALKSAFFRPNVLFLSAPTNQEDSEIVKTLLHESHRLHVAAMVLAMHPKAGLGRRAVVNLWIRPNEKGRSTEDALGEGNSNLAILCAYRLARAWDAEFNLICAVERQEDVPHTTEYIADLRDLCRIPDKANTVIKVGTLDDVVQQVSQSDMDFFGMRHDLDLEFVARMVKLTRSSCAFTMDSGTVNALA